MNRLTVDQWEAARFELLPDCRVIIASGNPFEYFDPLLPRQPRPGVIAYPSAHLVSLRKRPVPSKLCAALEV
jgi:hypothetical protein